MFILLLSQTGYSQEAAQGIVQSYQTHCHPPSGDQALFESYLKSQGEIARIDLLEQPPNAQLNRKKEILESQVNLSKSKCLILRISKALDENTKAKDIEKSKNGRSLFSQLAMYQGLANRELTRFRETDPCLLGNLKERLKCTAEVSRKHSQEQTSYNAVEFFMDLYQLALRRNPELTIADLGKIMEKRFEKDIKHLKDLPDPDDDEDDTGDFHLPPSPEADDLIPLKAIK